MKPGISGAALLALLCAAGGAAAQDRAGDVPVVDLAEARRRGAAVDPAAVRAAGAVESAVWERRAALADLLTPRVTAGLSYTRFSDPFFNFGTGQITPNATSATLQATYTLFGLDKVAALRRAGASLESAEAAEVAARFRAALEVDAAYYAVLADAELVRVAAERLRRAEEQFAMVRTRVQVGERVATDSLQLLLELSRARLGVVSRDSALAVSRLRLGRSIGLDGPADAAPLDTAPLPPLPLALEDAVREALARGPEAAAARANERRAAAALAAERMGYLPVITLGGTAGAYDAEFYPSALRRSQLSITLSWPLWDAGNRELAVARARAERNAARAERADVERAAAQVVAEAYHGYTTARAGVELAAVGVAAAAESYRVQSARYREGATTILDLLEAQVALNEAEAALVQARYGARLALARLEALLGRRLFDANMNPITR